VINRYFSCSCNKSGKAQTLKRRLCDRTCVVAFHDFTDFVADFPHSLSQTKFHWNVFYLEPVTDFCHNCVCNFHDLRLRLLPTTFRWMLA